MILKGPIWISGGQQSFTWLCNQAPVQPRAGPRSANPITRPILPSGIQVSGMASRFTTVMLACGAMGSGQSEYQVRVNCGCGHKGKLTI